MEIVYDFDIHWSDWRLDQDFTISWDSVVLVTSYSVFLFGLTTFWYYIIIINYFKLLLYIFFLEKYILKIYILFIKIYIIFFFFFYCKLFQFRNRYWDFFRKMNQERWHLRHCRFSSLRWCRFFKFKFIVLVLKM